MNIEVTLRVASSAETLVSISLTSLPRSFCLAPPLDCRQLPRSSLSFGIRSPLSFRHLVVEVCRRTKVTSHSFHFLHHITPESSSSHQKHRRGIAGIQKSFGLASSFHFATCHHTRRVCMLLHHSRSPRSSTHQQSPVCSVQPERCLFWIVLHCGSFG